jgi:BirA family biotin operon repressor/biotin-[acetyl-CoA-carboxylase] ligase
MTAPSGYRLVAYEEIDSTNTEAARLAASGVEDGTIVWARTQRAGRGRRGRAWVSPPGNLYCSILLRPDCRAREALQLGFVAALAAAEAIGRAAGGAGVSLKWPNDVLLNGRKIAGCLLESQASAGERLAWLVIGLGINVVSFPADVEFPATSLAAEGAVALAVEAIRDSYLAAFARRRWQWRHEGFAPVRAAWLGMAVGLGKDIRVRLERETLAGRFSALDADGGLVLALSDGSERVVTAGDIFSIAA